MKNRLDRVHCYNVRVKIEGEKVKATIILHDKVVNGKDDSYYGEMSWEEWINRGREEIINS